jgi:uncharacterized integral membrane protein
MARRDSGSFGPDPGRNVPGPGSRITPGGWRSIDEPTSKRAQYQLIAFGVFVVLAVLFIALNSRKVETRFIVFSVTTPLWVGLIVNLAVGVIIGWFLRVWFTRRSRSSPSRPE